MRGPLGAGLGGLPLYWSSFSHSERHGTAGNHFPVKNINSCGSRRVIWCKLVDSGALNVVIW